MSEGPAGALPLGDPLPSSSAAFPSGGPPVLVGGLSGGELALFVSDMHLGDHDRATAAMFAQALPIAAADASHLFLLGDLFEAWVGDDQPDQVVHEIRALLAGLVAEGRRLFVMRGNRDFLLDIGGGRFSAATGATMLEDPCRVALFGEPVVLSHGDALCTDDLDYQRVREAVRGPTWQSAFLARPLPERLKIALALRAESERAKATRYPTDVNAEAVDTVLRNAGAHTMIHGHTHRPACHEWQLEGQAARRWVLPDWEAGSGRGGFLRVDAAGFSWLDAAGTPR